MSFIDIIVHSLLEYSTDINEYIRYASALWSKYIEPFEAHSVEATLHTIMKTAIGMMNESWILPSITADFLSHPTIQNAIVELVSRRIQPIVRSMVEHGSQSLVLDTVCIRSYENEHNQSITSVIETDKVTEVVTPLICDFGTLRKCMLLAAYICQKNSSKSDNYFFRNQKHTHMNQQSVVNEEQLNATTIRSRSFSAERLLASYESVVRHSIVNNTSTIGNTYHAEQQCENERLLRNLVSDQNDESLLYFCDVGILHEVQKFSGKLFIQSSYWCSLSEGSAFELATSLAVDLERYFE
jgi:Origin recognition complex (ORC) subunit 5 C-terminus